MTRQEILSEFKAVNISCCVFQTILLQDKQDRQYCVACSELDADGNKDDPGEERFLPDR